MKEKPGAILGPAFNIVSASNSPASIARIPSTNDLVLVWNNNDANTPKLKAKRTPLNIAISKDEGKPGRIKKRLKRIQKVHFVVKGV